MKEFEVNGVQYMAVEVPSSYVVFELECRLGFSEREIWLICHDKAGMVKQGYKVGAGTWEIVGLVRELEYEIKGDLLSHEGETVTIKLWAEIKKEHNLNDNSLIIKKI